MKKSILLSTFILFCFNMIAAQGLNIDLSKESKEFKKEIDHEAFIDRLAIGESYEIQLSSMGCFGGSESAMKITRKAEYFVVVMNDKEIQLSEADLDDFRGFEKELVNIGKGYCTSMDNYTLTYKGEKIEKLDSTCSWNGFNRLKKKFKVG